MNILHPINSFECIAQVRIGTDIGLLCILRVVFYEMVENGIAQNEKQKGC